MKDTRIDLAHKVSLLNEQLVPSMDTTALRLEVPNEIADNMAGAHLLVDNFSGFNSYDEFKNIALRTEKACGQISEQDIHINADLDFRAYFTHLTKIEHETSIGNVKDFFNVLNANVAKIPASAAKIEALLFLMRTGILYGEWNVVRSKVGEVKKMMHTLDWEKKSSFKIYEALLLVFDRELEGAATLFLDCIESFRSHEIISYEKCVFLLVLSGIISLERQTIKSRILASPEVKQVISRLPHVQLLLESYCERKFTTFFQALCDVAPYIRADWILKVHYKYFLQELHTKAYIEFLRPYKIVQIAVLSASTGLSIERLEHELRYLIGTGGLNLMIDKVAKEIKCINTNRMYTMYQHIIRRNSRILRHGEIMKRCIVNARTTIPHSMP